MDPGEAEALRRRLYAPEVTEEDRRRYAAVVPETPDAVRPPFRPRIPVIVVVVAALLVAAGGAVLIGRMARPDVTRPIAAQAIATAAPSQRVISGAVERVPVMIDGVAAVGRRVRGEGRAVVPIDTTSASFAGGSVVVVLSSTDGRPMGWEARRLVTRQDWSSYQRVIASSPSTVRSGTPSAVSKPYSGAPPLWIAVEAPVGAVWTLTVALTSAKASALH